MVDVYHAVTYGQHNELVFFSSNLEPTSEQFYYSGTVTQTHGPR